MKQNRGVIIQPRRPTDFVAGGITGITYKVNNPTGNWRPFEPIHPVPQRSKVVDYMDCVSESAVHIIETQIKFLTGQDVDLSERFVAKMSGTRKTGNTQVAVMDAIRKYGIPLESDWPHPSDPYTTWDEFYAEIPQSVKDKALEFLKTWLVQYEFVDYDKVDINIKQAPLQVIIEETNPYHAQELVTTTLVFDSYPPYEKPLKSVYDNLKLLITPNNMNQTKVVLSKDGKTVYKAIPVATTWDDFVKQCGVEGIEVPNPVPPSSSL